MGTLPQDLTGKQFGRWTVLGPAPKRGKNRRWWCVCECGTERDVLGFQLNSGATVSCGCSGGTHGLWGSTEWNSWSSMRQRCNNPNMVYYNMYGGRGIYVCDRWQDSFENFYEDMGSKPSPSHSIERIDNDGPYSPENCRWATKKEQAGNRRSARTLTHEGETLSLTEWAGRLGITPNALYMRLYKGWSVEKALTYRRRT